MNLKIAPSESNTNYMELRLEGRLDGETAPALDEQLENLIQKKPAGLVLNIEALSYLSSAGIRTLFTAQSQLNEISSRLWVLAPQAAVLKVLNMVRILEPGTIINHRDEIDAW